MMSKTIPKNPAIFSKTWQPIPWQTFQDLVSQSEAEQFKFYYDRGYFKVEMSPLGASHGRGNSIVARLISLFATFQNIPIVEFTNTTFRKPSLQECQPDSSFYIGVIENIPPYHNKPIDLNQYEPPTLVIEVASTTLSDDLGQKRLLYERLGVQEYWVINTNNNRVTAFEMRNGGSREIRISQVLPNLEIIVVEEAIERSRTVEDGEVNRWLIELFTA